MAVISATEQLRGVSNARYTLASWRAAQRDCYRGFVWRVLADAILGKNRAGHVRSAPNSGHSWRRSACLKGARSELTDGIS